MIHLGVLKVIVPVYWIVFSFAAPTIDKLFLTQQKYNWVSHFILSVLYQLTGGWWTTTLFIINAGMGRFLFGKTEYIDAASSLVKYHCAPFGKQVRQKFDDPRFESDECQCNNPIRLVIFMPLTISWYAIQIIMFFSHCLIAFANIVSIIMFPFGRFHADMASQMIGKYFLEQDYPAYADQQLPIHAQPTVDLSSAAVDKLLSVDDSSSLSLKKAGEKNEPEAPPRPTLAPVVEEEFHVPPEDDNVPPPTES
jgi:uncharacterized membrane protein YccF (DUF307 family)